MKAAAATCKSSSQLMLISLDGGPTIRLLNVCVCTLLPVSLSALASIVQVQHIRSSNGMMCLLPNCTSTVYPGIVRYGMPCTYNSLTVL